LRFASQATSKKSPTTGTELTRKSMPTLRSIRASVSFEAPLFQAWRTIGSEMTLVATSGRKQADNGIQPESGYWCPHCELVVIHQPRDEAHVGEALLMRQLLAVVARELGAGFASRSAMRIGAAEIAAHHLQGSNPGSHMGLAATRQGLRERVKFGGICQA
jgi:hypothetical protein